MRPAKSIREAVQRLTGGLEIKAYDPKEKPRQTFRSIIHDLIVDQEIRRNLDFVVKSMILRSRRK